MGTLTGEQIGYLIVKNGAFGPGGDKAAVTKFLDTAIAVALAESGGNTDAVNKNKNGSTDYGLFQINSVHADLLAKGDWRNAADNVEMARVVWADAGHSFSPWTTYTTGTYKQFLGHGPAVYSAAESAKKGNSSVWDAIGAATLGPAGAAVDALTGHHIGDAVGNVIKGPGQIVAGALKDVMTWLQKGFVVIGATLLALILLGLGVWLLISNTSVGRKVKETAGDAAKVAAVV